MVIGSSQLKRSKVREKMGISSLLIMAA